LQTPATPATLHDYVTTLLADADCRAVFDQDPTAALRAAGLGDLSPQDVYDAIPLVMDFASATGTDSPATMLLSGQAATDFGGGQVGVDGANQTVAGEVWMDQDTAGNGGYDFSISPDGIASGTSLNFGEFSATGIDADALGRGGDGVTGAVAGYLSNGPVSFADALTGGSAALSGAVTYGADSTAAVVSDLSDQVSDGLSTGGYTVGGLIDQGAADLGATLDDPTSAQLPHLPQLPELSIPALPHLPGLPGLPGLPALPELPVDHLPQVPGAPALPEMPQLPSVGGVDAVHDTVGGLLEDPTSLGHGLTDSITDHLSFGH
jgi:hypothetical protein